VIAIDTGAVLVGELPSRALKLVNEWATAQSWRQTGAKRGMAAALLSRSTRFHKMGFFAQVRVDDELETVVWPNGADLDPLVLHGDFEPASHIAHR
jgi:hypothetical protein